MANTPDSPLEKKSELFAKRVVKMTLYLQQNGLHTLGSMYNQVLRSGTSIAANIAEAQFAQSSADFITKLHISLKEANETRKWLNLLKEADCLTEKQYESMNSDLSEIIAMLVSSIKTTKKNNSNKNGGIDENGL